MLMRGMIKWPCPATLVDAYERNTVAPIIVLFWRPSTHFDPCIYIRSSFSGCFFLNPNDPQPRRRLKSTFFSLFIMFLVFVLIWPVWVFFFSSGSFCMIFQHNEPTLSFSFLLIANHLFIVCVPFCRLLFILLFYLFFFFLICVCLIVFVFSLVFSSSPFSIFIIFLVSYHVLLFNS